MADKPTTETQPVTWVADLDIAAARQRLAESASRHTSTVAYRSAGQCLVVGSRERALEHVSALRSAGVTRVTVVTVDPDRETVDKALTEDGTSVFVVPDLRLSGYLGAFSAVVIEVGVETSLAASARLEGEHFDLVLDLSAMPLLSAALPPFGYVHAVTDEAGDAAVDTLAGLVGEFDKPRYFAYDASICAHSRSRLQGCSRCIDICAAGAIESDGEGVVVDPYLCQGCGSCATLCPTGAMVYAYPKPSDAIARTRESLAATGATTLVLHDESAQDAIDAANLPAYRYLTLQVEEVSAFGIDYWAAMLAAGVNTLWIVTDAATTRDTLSSQANVLERLVAPLGLGPAVVRIMAPEALLDGSSDSRSSAADRGSAGSPVSSGSAGAAAFTTHDDKRQTVRLAMDALWATHASTDAQAEQPVTSLPSGSPFGHIHVDTDACTLCMACVSTCPAGSLLDGQDTPALRMIEANCVQCGLCEQACPEHAITLEARWVHDSVAARRARTLAEETPFHCVVCNRAFATRTLIDRVLGKLQGHWMFTDAAARRRLMMCEDCRVKDIFDKQPEGLDVHAGPAPAKDDSTFGNS